MWNQNLGEIVIDVKSSENKLSEAFHDKHKVLGQLLAVGVQVNSVVLDLQFIRQWVELFAQFNIDQRNNIAENLQYLGWKGSKRELPKVFNQKLFAVLADRQVDGHAPANQVYEVLFNDFLDFGAFGLLDQLHVVERVS